jgi:hypothetical protein
MDLVHITLNDHYTYTIINSNGPFRPHYIPRGDPTKNLRARARACYKILATFTSLIGFPLRNDIVIMVESPMTITSQISWSKSNIILIMLCGIFPHYWRQCQDPKIT